MRGALVVALACSLAGEVRAGGDPHAASSRALEQCREGRAHRDLAAARADCKRAIAAWDGNAAAWFELGLLEPDHGDLSEAIDALTHANALDPDDPVVLTWLGAVRFRAHRDGDAAKARAVLERAITVEPKLWRAHYWLGRIARETSDPDTAAAQLSQSIQLAPDEPDGYISLTVLYLDAGAYDQAGAVAELGIAHVPAGAERTGLYRLAGDAAVLRGDDERAIDAYTHVLDGAPSDVEVQLARGLAYARKGSAAEAKHDLEQALAHAAPQDAYTRIAARQALRALGN
jgi:tetratricopeptide (TPR) repeat protein